MLNIGDTVVLKKRVSDIFIVGSQCKVVGLDPNGVLIKFKHPIQNKYCYLRERDVEKVLNSNEVKLSPNINNSNQGESMPTNKKTVCEINFTRQQGEQLLYVKTTKEIAELFKSANGVAKSENYFDKDGNNLRYQKEETEKLAQYVSKFQSQGYGMGCKLDRYGTNFIIDRAYNFSILRTKGIADGVTVKVNELILEDDVANWVQALGAFLKFLHRNYIDKVEVKATITMDL